MTKKEKKEISKLLSTMWDLIPIQKTVEEEKEFTNMFHNFLSKNDLWDFYKEEREKIYGNESI